MSTHDAGLDNTAKRVSMAKDSVPTADVTFALRHGSWAEALALLTAALDQLEEDGHSYMKLRAALMSLAQKGWPRNKQGTARRTI